MVPIYGAVSEETAHLVLDYPCGFRARCSIRYWIESHPKKGFRFVSQTTNPKTGSWNKPKKSTYSDVAENLYIDDMGHVHSTAITSWSDGEDVLKFLNIFPSGDRTLLIPWAAIKLAYHERQAPIGEFDREKNEAAKIAWRKVKEALEGMS